MASLLIIGGVPASGKTTIAQILEERLGWPVVSVDRIKEGLFDAVGYRDRKWSQELGKLSFFVFQKTIALYLERGESVIAESTFLFPSDAEWLYEYADRYGIELRQIWVTAHPHKVRERFIERSLSDRHCGHCDNLDLVKEEFDQKYFTKSFSLPLLHDVPTLVVNTDDWNVVDMEEIVRFGGK